MRIKNIDGLTTEDLEKEVQEGGKFVYYSYTLSLIIITWRQTTGVYLIRGTENAVSKGWKFSLLTFLFGWWGIPFGPKHTIQSLRINLKGGNDVTNDVMAVVEGYALYNESRKAKSA